ncbi:KDO2-lipid IV(A) lauroyltransferase [Dyadobacter jejuensis]|uniref:KDO2-lipid IV(A) lauroyltransferase n=1 Tax=Dyadobacter jejuensis TaxID=1082580 RepID=A0A316ALN6_9BACT|nr:lysophospholipid acyltransferase family protein [Dyadobacter jejuensis]PWJ58318.1 KDO2-lipid IV(A) lauroyltransferase [Dyadobacter jejuensis]
MNKIGTYTLLKILNLFSNLSWKYSYWLSDALKWIIFDVVGYRKKVIAQNLKRSFPEKSDAALHKIAEDFYLHFSDLLVETIKLKKITSSEINDRLQGDISIMDGYFRSNTNLIYLMGHRGNWELANLFSSLRFSHDCIVVYRPLQNKDSDEWFLDLRTRFGAKLVPMDEIFKELQKPRTTPYCVVLANDQSPNPKTAFWTQFLHQDTGIFRGVEAMARRYDLTVLYADFRKAPHQRGHYEVEITVITENPKDEPVNGILEKQIRLLEQDICNQPHNWLWSHRRWKHARPVHLRPDQVYSQPSAT